MAPLFLVAWARQNRKTHRYCFSVTFCDDLVVKEITVVQCPFVCIHAHNSTNVLISEITAKNPIDSPNTACVYADSLVNSRITNSAFSCGDDHITVLAQTRKTENMLIDNSVFYHGQGLTIGSQVYQGMTNVTYRDIVMIGALTGIRMKAQRNTRRRYRRPFVRKHTATVRGNHVERGDGLQARRGAKHEPPIVQRRYFEEYNRVGRSGQRRPMHSGVSMHRLGVGRCVSRQHQRSRASIHV